MDRSLAWLLAVAGLLHAFGSYRAYGFLSPTLVWAWAGTVAALLLAALNLLRAGRPGDHGLAWVSFSGCVAWIAVCVAFASTLPNPWDVRPLVHVVLSFALALFSLRSAQAVRL